MYWLAILTLSEKVLGSIPGQGRISLCEICIFPHLFGLGFPQVIYNGALEKEM